MATESPVRILEGTDKWSSLRHTTKYGPSSAKMAIEDLGLFLKGQSFRNFEIDVVPSRSESAPPSMEGSITAIENIFSRQRFAPGVAYPSFSTINRESPAHRDSVFSSDRSFNGARNSWEGSYLCKPNGITGSEWKMAPDVKHASSSVLIPENNLPAHVEEPEDDQSSEQSVSVYVEKAALLGYHSGSLDSLQDDSRYASSSSYDQFPSLSHKSMDERVNSDADSLHSVSVSTSVADTDTPSSDDIKQVPSLDGTGGTVKRPYIHETDGNAVKVDTSDSLSAVGISDVDSAHTEGANIVNVPSASNTDSGKFHKKEQLIPQDEVLQQRALPHEGNPPQVQGSYSRVIYPGITLPYGSVNQLHYGTSSVSVAEVQPLLHSSGFTPPAYATTAAFMTSPTPYYPNLQPATFLTPQYSTGGYYFSSAALHPYMAGYPPYGAVPQAFGNASFPPSGVPGGSLHAYDVQNVQKFYGQVGFPLRHPLADHFHLQYVQPAARESYSTHGQFDRQTPRDGAVVNQMNLRDSKKGAESVALPNDHNPHNSNGGNYNNLNLRRGNASSHHSLGSPSNTGSLLQFPAASVVTPIVLAKPAAGTNFSGGRYSPSHSHSFRGNPTKGYGLQSRSWNDMNSYSVLEELKSGNGQRFELSDIQGHIGEFSVDQHGSRFIQQRLETCSIDEKASVLKEVIPHTPRLVTDVFGNYVVQKLFEYGSPEQRKELANQLEGQILPLSLQMYGCRVIQKALEVIDLEQKVRLVRELDGHVMRCVRDQNGNHVIQKCIESIPGDTIHFIISSFHDQVATLSTHPYGCRVIQRVLEHYSDELHTHFIVDEILDSVCSLVQDQYGNYVTQHVLERGKPRERSEIIQKLGRSIVKLSQHKFASNVVEKCLEYSDSTERDMLIKEIVGHGDKNDNLLIMMKDQYANYVIQKILQKCTGDQREMLLGLIRNHLTALKKYTYGKHIAARFEQLCGEETQTSGS